MSLLSPAAPRGGGSRGRFPVRHRHLAGRRPPRRRARPQRSRAQPRGHQTASGQQRQRDGWPLV